MRRFLFLSLFLSAALAHAEENKPAASAPAAPAPPPSVKPDESRHVMRVNVTNQNWDFMRPWGKRPPFSRRAVGPVLAGGRVLVTAELVANATYIEFELPDGSDKTVAQIEAVDYECNLAVLRCDNVKFLSGAQAVEFTEAKVGDTLNIWQLENTGVVLSTSGPLTTVEVTRYPTDDSAFLVYRATAAIQFRDSSFTIPAMKGGKLAGLVVRYENQSNSAEIVPTPVIRHFLKDADKKPYEGFPRSGIAFSATRDPQLRRFIGLNGQGGVYVTEVLKDSPGAKAGLRAGDVILSIDGQVIDPDGNYVDPDYGKLSMSHLISTKHYAGDVVKVSIQREGKKIDLPLTLAHRDLASYVSEPYVIDRAPNFFIVGGLVLQELSRQYLKEFGNDWQKRAPQELVYLDRYQQDLFAEGPKKIVFLSRVLPMPSTLGYEELNHLRVTKINGVALQGLADVPAALEKPDNGLHKIEFDADPGVIYLDAASLKVDEQALITNYRLPATMRLQQ